MMENAIMLALAVVGAVLVLVILFAIICAVWAWALERFAPRNDASYYAGIERGHKDFIDKLRNDAWWFSEHVPTMNILARFADGMGVSEVREEWRKEIKSNEL